jgi:hypothetical protein
MKHPCDFDHTLLGALIARRWEEEPGYYTVNGNVDRGWLEAFWMQRADPSGVELHWRREPGPHWAAQRLSTSK